MSTIPGKSLTSSVINPAVENDIETVEKAHPPIQAWSNTAGINAVAGHDVLTDSGVLGTSVGGDGVHGESRGTSMSGVAGIHLKGGNGVYGRSSGNAGCFDGNVQVNGNVNVTGDVMLTGADCAEQFAVTSDQALRPGDVLVIGEDGRLQRSAHEYDRRVAGVVASAGDFRPGIVLDSQPQSQSERAAVSLLGKVYCFADASYGAITPGDLLTTSNTPGHAMRAADAARCLGSIMGKALGALGEGTGLIPMLVTMK